MAREDPHFRLRIPEYLKEQVEKAAADGGQSMTAEIVRRLHQSFDEDHMIVPASKELRERINRYAQAHHRTAEAEVARILEREFPPALPVEYRLQALLKGVGMLKQGMDSALLDEIGLELFNILEGLAQGSVKGIDEGARKALTKAFRDLDREGGPAEYLADLDEDEREALRSTRTTAKY